MMFRRFDWTTRFGWSALGGRRWMWLHAACLWRSAVREFPGHVGRGIALLLWSPPEMASAVVPFLLLLLCLPPPPIQLDIGMIQLSLDISNRLVGQAACSAVEYTLTLNEDWVGAACLQYQSNTLFCNVVSCVMESVSQGVADNGARLFRSRRYFVFTGSSCDIVLARNCTKTCHPGRMVTYRSSTW